jgi:hypothetical protein
MIRRFICVALGLMSALAARAATETIHLNNSPVNGPAPQIDATAFVNQSIFNITTSSGLPYSTLNTLFFTNRPGGLMNCATGFRFDFFTNNFRYSMNTWANQGSGSITGASIVLISATNIINSGSIYAGADGLIRLTGRNLNLAGGKIRTGAPDNVIYSGGSTFGTNYSSAPGIVDLYWGAGTNNHLDANGVAMNLNGTAFTDLIYQGQPFPIVQSPQHQVVDSTFIFGGGTFLFTNLVTVGGFGYGAFAHRSQLGPTNFLIQIVFAPTNNFDTNLTTQVRFYTNFGNVGAVPVVLLGTVDLDIVTRRQNTNALYLVDTAGQETNFFLAVPTLGGTPRRPNNYELFRNEPFFFPAYILNGNTPFTPNLIYNPNYLFTVVTNGYAGYAASVNSSFTGTGTGTTDPSNLVGRIEIVGDTVSLDQARIRAESTLTVRTSNLTSNRLAQVDAPFLNYDLRSIQPQMVISNLAPSLVRRLSGQIAAWTGKWKNYEATPTATNEIDFHVLIVDNFLQSASPVVVNEFAARAPHLDISDNLSIRKSFLLQATRLNISGGLTLPFGSSWAPTNVIGVSYFTNSGTISIFQSGSFGTPPDPPYQEFVNSGTIGAANLDIRAVNFRNAGLLAANGGSISVTAQQLDLHGKPTILFTNIFTNIFFNQIFVVTNITTNSLGPRLAADSEVQLDAQAICFSNAIVSAGAGIYMTASDRIIDSGQQAINEWTTFAGFQIPSLPPTSDLLATHIRSVANPSVETVHVWPGMDEGPVANGYHNNLAVGKLSLDGGEFSLFHFTGAGPQCALYVDYLEFLNAATNYNDQLAIDDNIVIYFGNANISPGKLDGRHNGHLRWVKSFTGPLSGTNIVYPSGRVYTFNAGLARDKDLDSDGDGIVNGEDPTPFFVEESIDLRIAYTNAPTPRALVSWWTLTGANNQVEYRANIASGSWQVLTNFTQTAASGRVTIQAPIAGQTRFYRVRVQPPSLD